MADRTVSVNLRARVSQWVSGMGQAKKSTEDLSRQMVQTGAYAAQFRQRLEAATKALPKIEIDADSSPAEIKFAQLRADMEKLADKKIGIDISAEDAKLQLAEIERELEKIQGQSATIDVKADIGAALAELRAVDSEISRINGKDARVQVDADVSGALASIAMVGAALASLPAVTTIAVGVTALGGAFAAAGAGAASFAAVAVPSLSRINEALKAQESAAKSAGGATGGAGQSAAQAAQQALQLEQAEKRLADAQREEKQAQEDLTRAREDGRRALEDMNFSLERSILSQKDAALAVREAEARLADVQAKHSEGKASDLELERAMLSLEQAQQRSREQEVKTARARKDTAEANKAGVKGTKEYQDGLENLRQAEDKVAQAEAQLKMLHLQQQAAMSSGGGAAAKLKDAFADLSKQEKVLAKDIKAFKDEYLAWQRALQPAVFPAIHQGLDLMRLGLEKAGPLAKTAGAAFLTLGKEAEAALTGQFWTDFLDNVNTAMPAAILGLGRSFGNVATGVAGVIDAFLPFTSDVVDPIEAASKAFSEWGQNLKNNREFHEFLLFVKENAPEVWEVVKNLADALFNIGEAVAPLGVGAFSGLGVLAKLVAGMDPEHIQLIALAIVAIKTAQAGLGVARFFTEIPGRLGAVRDGFDKAKTAAGKFGDTVGGLRDKIGGFGALVGGAALTGGLLILEERLNQNAIAAARFAEKVEALAGGNVDSQIRALTDEINRLKDSMGPSLDLGVVNLAPFSWDNELDKIEAMENRIGQLRHQKELDAIASKTAGGAMTAMGDQASGAAGKMDGLNQSMTTFASRTDALLALQNMKAAYHEAEKAIQAANGKLQVNAQMTDKQRDAVIAAREKFMGYIESVRLAADGAQTLSGKTTDGTRVILEQLPQLTALAGKNQEAREQVIKLAEAYGISRNDAIKAMNSAKGLRDMIAQLKSKEIEIQANTEKAKQAIKDLLNLYIKPVEIPIGIKAPATPPTTKKKAAGGIEMYATGGIRSTPPNVAASPTILYGEGAAAEAFIPYEMKYRSRAIDLLSQVANDFGLQLNNQQAAQGLANLSVTLDQSGLQIADGLASVMDSLESTMGQAGSLTGSIGKVGSSADQLNAAWLAGSEILGETVSLLGTTTSTSVDGLSGSVDTLSEAIAFGQDVIAELMGGKAKGKSGKSKGSAKGTSGGLIAGHDSLSSAQVSAAQTIGEGSLAMVPPHYSKMSAPQQMSSTPGLQQMVTEAVTAAITTTGGGTTVNNKNVIFNGGQVIKETADADVLFAKADLYTRG